MITQLHVSKLILLICLVDFVSSVRCPDSSQWKLKAKSLCNNTHSSYNCLFDEDRQTYTEFCTTMPDFQRPGYKFIIRGNKDAIKCSKDMFQPIKFWTNISSDCILRKVSCAEDGQNVSSSGNSTTDRNCRCDYTRGFAFVSPPKQGCLCNPNTEDCSCYKKTCSEFHVLTPDYDCIKINKWTGIFRCPSMSIKTNEDPNQDRTQCQRYPDNSKQHSKISTLKMALVPTILTMSLILIVVVFKRRGRKTMECCSKVSKMTSTIEQTIENKLIEAETKRKNIMHESNRCKAAMKLNVNAIISTMKNEEIVCYLKDKGVLTGEDQESIQSKVGKRKKNYKLFKILVNLELLPYTEFIQALRSNDLYAELANQIEQSKDKVSQTHEDINIEINDLYNNKIPKEVRSLHESHIRDWYSKDKMIIETTVSLHIMKQLKDKHCAVIVGHQGNGKSSILQHIALLECNNEDFDIIPIVIEPNYITQYYNPKRNQIFLVDDLCGKEKVNSQHIDIWNLYIKDVIQIIKRGSYSDADKNEKNRGKTKILISCNETIYNDPVFRCLKEKLDHYVCFLSKYPLSEEEKKEMLRKYSPGADAGFENMNRKEIDFPLLCKLTKGKSIEEIKELFSNPVCFIKNDLNELRNKNNLQFCIIALCTLFDNSFEAKWLQGDVMPKNVKSAAEEIGLDLKKESTIKYVQEEFEKQDLLYLSKTGTTYHLIHEEIHNIASVICGNIYTECFIRYSSSSFVAQRYRMEPANELRDKAVILAPKYYKRYFDRLLSDLENCDTYSTFHNIQLREKNYRDEFCKYCRKRKQKFIEILSKLKQNTQKCKSTENENDDDYGFLKCNIYFRDHKLGIPLIECAWEGHADMIKLLMEMDCNINETDGFGRTALFVASARGHLDVVEMLLYEHNADVSLSDKKKRTPLYSACEEGYEQIAIKLIEKGADILARDKDGCSSFFKACAHGHKHIAEILLEKCKEEIHNTDNLGRTPIIEAARHGQKNIVIFLLDKGANMNDTDSKGFTPLYVASMKDYSQTVLVLLNKGADMLKLDNDGCTALYIACKNGCTKAVKKLVAKNKEIISIRDWHQRTPFYIACEEGHTDVVEILVKENVDVEVCEEDEKSPLYISCENGYLKVVQILLENSVNVNKCDRRDNSPLHAACKMGHFEIVQLLCSKGANLLHCDRRGGSPFFVACREGYIEIVKFLLDEYDYVLNKCDNSGNSPLFAACEEGNIEIVQFLLSNGADIEYANSKNISAIDAASAGGYEKIKKMLMDKKSSLKSNTAQQLPQSVGLRKKSLCLIPK